MALVEVETRGRGRIEPTCRTSSRRLFFDISVVNLLCVQPVDFDFTLSIWSHCMRRSRHRSIYIKIITLPRFFNHTREHVRSTKVLRNVVMHLWNSEADVMLKTLTTTCMSLFLFFKEFLKFSCYFFFVRHGRYFEGSRLSIQVIKINFVVCNSC
jgi:hypothetical protein